VSGRANGFSYAQLVVVGDSLLRVAQRRPSSLNILELLGGRLLVTTVPVWVVLEREQSILALELVLREVSRHAKDGVVRGGHAVCHDKFGAIKNDDACHSCLACPPQYRPLCAGHRSLAGGTGPIQ